MWTFKPILKTTIWGGERIAKFKNIHTDLNKIGESWEISAVKGSESVVAEGPDKGLTLPQLVDKYGARLLGERNMIRFNKDFPLLVKFIDAREDLSVQVHPGDELARDMGMPFGKTEMWYVIDAAPGARLANGFNHTVNPEKYEDLVKSGDIIETLGFMPIHPGEAFYIPSGRVHSIGAGSLLCEIQQSSDITFRLYDYHRKDADGNERELHTAQAFGAINFNDTCGGPIPYSPSPDMPVNLVTSAYFTTNLWDINREVMRDYSELDTFVIIIALSGNATLICKEQSFILEKGHSVLIPASANSLIIQPGKSFKALETYIK